MTQLRGSGATVAGRLIPNRKVGRCRPKRGERILTLLYVECVEAGPNHKMQLLHEHIADGSDLTGETVTFAQQPRVRVGTTVAKLRKLQRDDRKVIEVCGDELRRLIAAQTNAEQRIARKKVGAVRLPLLQADDDRARRRLTLLRRRRGRR